MTWTDESLCADQPYTVFFPEGPDRRRNARLMAHAKRLCARCPVADDCLREGLANPYPSGIWGGYLLQKSTGRYAGDLAAAKRRLAELDSRFDER